MNGFYTSQIAVGKKHISLSDTNPVKYICIYGFIMTNGV